MIMYKQVEAAKTAKLENGCEITPIATLVDNAGFAYSKALAFESLDLREKFDYEKQVFNDVTFDDIEKYAKIIAYKVASNLNNGFVMDKDEDPLDYGK